MTITARDVLVLAVGAVLGVVVLNVAFILICRHVLGYIY